MEAVSSFKLQTGNNITTANYGRHTPERGSPPSAPSFSTTPAKSSTSVKEMKGNLLKNIFLTVTLQQSCFILCKGVINLVIFFNQMGMESFLYCVHIRSSFSEMYVPSATLRHSCGHILCSSSSSSLHVSRWLVYSSASLHLFIGRPRFLFPSGIPSCTFFTSRSSAIRQI